MKGSVSKKVNRDGKLLIISAASLIGLGVLWQFTPLKEWIHPHQLFGFIRGFSRENPLAPVVIGALVGIGNTLLIPINVMLLAVAMALPGWKGFFCGLLGSLVAALLQAELGNRIGAERVRRRFGDRFDLIASEVSKNGFTSVLVLSLLPVAPNFATNVVAGVCKVPKLKLIMGTVVGFLPGLIVLNLLGRQMRTLLQDPSFNAAFAAIGLVGFIVLSQVIMRSYKRRLRSRKIALPKAKKYDDGLTVEPVLREHREGLT